MTKIEIFLICLFEMYAFHFATSFSMWPNYLFWKMTLKNPKFPFQNSKKCKLFVRNSQLLALQPYKVHLGTLPIKRKLNCLSIDIWYVHIGRASAIPHLIEEWLGQIMRAVHVYSEMAEYGTPAITIHDQFRGAITQAVVNISTQSKHRKIGNFVL